MNAITGFPANLDPQLNQYAESALQLMQLQALQTVAAHKDPSNYALKPRKVRVPNIVKQFDNTGLFVDRWLRAMPQEKRAKILARFNLSDHITPELGAGAAQAGIDLRSPKPVLEQVDLKARFAYLDKAFVQKAAAARKFDEPAAGSAPRSEHSSFGSVASIGAVRPSTALKLRLHKMECSDEFTTTEWATKDNIHIGGSAIDDQEKTTAIPQFHVGSFDDGSVRAYNPPKVLKTFNLSGTYPKTFVCLLVPAELDRGGFTDFLANLTMAVSEEVEAVVTAAGMLAGAAAGGTVGGPLGILIGTVGVFLVGEIIKFINKTAHDEILQPGMTAVQLESSGHRFANGSRVTVDRVMRFKEFNGEYVLTYSWELV